MILDSLLIDATTKLFRPVWSVTKIISSTPVLLCNRIGIFPQSSLSQIKFFLNKLPLFKLLRLCLFWIFLVFILQRSEIFIILKLIVEFHILRRQSLGLERYQRSHRFPQNMRQPHHEVWKNSAWMKSNNRFYPIERMSGVPHEGQSWVAKAPSRLQDNVRFEGSSGASFYTQALSDFLWLSSRSTNFVSQLILITVSRHDWKFILACDCGIPCSWERMCS